IPDRERLEPHSRVRDFFARTASGYVARVIQHEIDHLDGIEFVDRMTSMESLTTVTNYLEFHR
ncbi:MAG: peptide deformylase, partial [Actinobacteria bacterium]|nr:peptide deformylase [Actinomycetota bacterium]